MNTVEYDLDTSGGLMPQIQALIAPPVSEDSGKRLKKEREHRYRRPGRAVNHDCCDSCKEGGDLICCDRCPATFHLQCHDPPLSEDDLPSGEWICHRCHVMPDHILSYSAMDDDSKDKSSNQDEGGGGTMTRGVTRKEQSEAAESSARKRVRFEKMYPLPQTAEEESRNPLATLIRAAAAMNPKQFQLPNEMSCMIQLPDSFKATNNKKSKPKNNNHKKTAYELDNGIVPLPAKLCFQCRKSCRKAPLVQCDYCPLLFHADCLDPPLTTLPVNRWMCPNHPEHILEEKLLTSVSLTERVKLWDHFGGHMSQDAIKIAFLKKIHRVDPPFRCKRKFVGKPTIRVPEAIKAQYKNPPPLLPRLTDKSSYYQFGSDNGATLEEQEHWLSSVVFLQTSIAKYLAQQQLKSCRTNNNNEDAVFDSKLLNLDSKFLPNGVPNVKTCTENGPLQSDDHQLVATSDKTAKLNLVSRTIANNNNVAVLSGGTNSTSVLLPRMTSSTTPSLKINTISNKISPSATQVKLFSASSQKGTSVNNLSSSPAILNLNSNLQSSIEGNGEDIELSKLDERLISILAWQRLQQLLPQKNSNNNNTSTAVKKGINGFLSPGVNEVKARAVICPLSGKGPSILMPYRTLTIGTGADMDVCLSTYGQCNYVSPKHACIFYDEITKHYELMNYSDHGTTVDNVLYSCDFSEKHVQRLPPNSVVSSVRKLVEKTKSKNEEMQRATMSGRAGQTSRSCNCKKSGSTLIGGSGAGWEGTALLHHGSFIKCGCLQFVFSITEYSTKLEDNSTTQ